MIDERNEDMIEEIISTKEVNTSLSNYENSLLAYVGSFGLPTEGILVPIAERKSVIRNFEDVVDLLRQEDISGAVYISIKKLIRISSLLLSGVQAEIIDHIHHRRLWKRITRRESITSVRHQIQ